MTEPERVTGSSVYPYANELIVELTGVDGDGILVVLSYQFEYGDGDVVTPKGRVEPEYAEPVAAALEEQGYRWPGRPDADD